MDGERRGGGDERARMARGDLPHTEATQGLRGREAVEESPAEHGAELVLCVVEDDRVAAMAGGESRAAGSDAEVHVLADVRVLGVEASDRVERSALGQQVRGSRP